MKTYKGHADSMYDAEMNGKWKIHIVPHWHFDALWQLTFEEYFDITARNLMDLLEFLETNPEYRFCLDQTIYIEEFLKQYPELGEKLGKVIRAGTVEPVCSGYTQPDPNLPSGEFLVRNTVLYKAFMKKSFGVDAKCGWYMDTYGQSAQLPQIFKEAGVDYFSFWRGVPKEIPSEFIWKGIDGSQILTHRMPLSYGGILPHGEMRYGYSIPGEVIDAGTGYLEGRFDQLKRYASTRNMLIPNGGDFAPPQRDLPDVVQEWKKRRGDLEIHIATPTQFFKSLEDSIAEIPTIETEFNPLFRGYYTTRIKIKQENRKCENLYLDAEKFVTIASLLGFSYPEKALEKALKLILLNDFHDAINGEVIDEVYVKMMEDYNKIEDICQEVLGDSLRNIAEKIDVKGEGIPIVVFNQLSWTRTDVVEVHLALAQPGTRGVVLRDCHGQEIPFEASVSRNPDGTLNRVNLLFVAYDVPPVGYKTYFALPSEAAIPSFETSIRTSDENGRYRIENEFYSITVDPISKAIVNIYDKDAGKEVLETDQYLGNVLFDESDYGSVCHINGDIDGHQFAIPIKDLPNPQVADSTMKCVPSGSIAERGPIRATIYSSGTLNKAKFTQRITVYNKIKRIEFATDVEFEGEHRRIRVSFPIKLDSGEIWHEIPYGAIRRDEGEYPAINWVDLSNKSYGVTLINQGLPGNSVVKNVMLISLLRSIDAMYLGRPFGDARLERVGKMFLEHADRFFTYYPLGRMALEKGSHAFRYALYPHTGTWRDAKSYKTGYEFNNRLIAVKTTNHAGSLPMEQSFISAEPDNLVITAVKRSGTNVLIRFYEAAGEKTNAKLHFFSPIHSAWKTNLLEEEQERIGISDNALSIGVDPFKIVSVLLTLD